METVLIQKDVENLVKILSRVITKNISHPALKLTRIQIQKDKIIFSSTNLSLGVEIIIPSIVTDFTEEKMFYLQTEVFVKTLSSILIDDKVKVLFKDTYTEVKTKQSKSKVVYEDGADMPFIPQSQGDVLEIQKDIFIKSISLTSPAASLTEIKPELSAILVSQKDNIYSTVATDAFQLVEFTEPFKNTQDYTYLLPIKESLDVLKCLESFTESKINFIKSDSLIEFKTFNIRVVCRIINGMFPDYKQIIPTNFNTTVNFLYKDFEDAIKFITQNNPKNNHVLIEVKQGIMYFKINNVSNGENEFFINVNQVGDDFTLYTLLPHLKNTLTIIKGDSLFMGFVNNQKPIVMRITNKDLITYLVMPISI